MTTRAQRLAMFGLGALALTLGVAAAFAFASPGDGSIPQRGVAVYDLDTLDAAEPLYDERVPAWIVALPEGGYRAFAGDRHPWCPVRWLHRGEIRSGFEPPPSDPGAFQDRCLSYYYFDVRGRPACVADPTFSRTGVWQHLEEFAASVDTVRGLLVVDLDATSLEHSVCHRVDSDGSPPPTPAAPPSSPR